MHCSGYVHYHNMLIINQDKCQIGDLGHRHDHNALTQSTNSPFHFTPSSPILSSLGLIWAWMG